MDADPPDDPAACPTDPLSAVLAEAVERRRRGERGIVAVDAVTIQWVVFSIGDRSYAFPGTQVREILPLPPIHFVPGCPPALEGVIDVRGTIWSVLRLGELLGSAHGMPSRRAAILLGSAAGMDSGLRVDAVDDVLEVAQRSVLVSPAGLPEWLAGLVSGVFQYQGRTVLALDMERLFSDWCDGRW